MLQRLARRSTYYMNALTTDQTLCLAYEDFCLAIGYIFYEFINLDELVTTMFSRKGAKNAKKKLFNINALPLRALLAQLNLFCICLPCQMHVSAERSGFDWGLTGAALREIVTFYDAVNLNATYNESTLKEDMYGTENSISTTRRDDWSGGFNHHTEAFRDAGR